jgi:hypothetical protein
MRRRQSDPTVHFFPFDETLALQRIQVPHNGQCARHIQVLGDIPLARREAFTFRIRHDELEHLALALSQFFWGF